MPGTPLPPPGSNSEESYKLISNRFQEHYSIEKAKGNKLQASEKIWGSVAHALKAAAISRGWQHDNHFLLSQVANQLGSEAGQLTEYVNHMALANEMHRNFYENEYGWDGIEHRRQDARQFIKLIDKARVRKPNTFTIKTEEDQNRIAHLLGLPTKEAVLNRLLPIGTASAEGFAPAVGYKIPTSRRPDLSALKSPEPQRSPRKRTNGSPTLTQESIDHRVKRSR